MIYKGLYAIKPNQPSMKSKVIMCLEITTMTYNGE